MRLSRPPRLRNLRAFCVAAQHRSFKIAADELFLTPSAVSHQMKELEDSLGVRLFERKTRALELTTAGHTLLDEGEPLLEAPDRSLAQIAPGNGIQNDTRDPRPSIHPATADVSILLSDQVPQGLSTSRLFSLSLTAVCAKEHAPTVARLGSEVFRQMALIVH